MISDFCVTTSYLFLERFMTPRDLRTAHLAPSPVNEAHNLVITRYAGIILGMGSANERRRYIVTSSLIGWAHAKNDPYTGQTATCTARLFMQTTSANIGICASACLIYPKFVVKIPTIFPVVTSSHSWKIDIGNRLQ